MSGHDEGYIGLTVHIDGDFDPADLARGMEITPTRTARKGEHAFPGKGRFFGHDHIRFADDIDQDLPTGLARVLPDIERLCTHPGVKAITIDIGLRLRPEMATSSFTVPPDQLARLATTGAALEITIYPPAE